MQSADQAQNEEVTLVTAEAMREMTITKEALFERQKTSVLDALMSSMTRQASENGNTSYVANLNPQFDPSLLAKIVEQLKQLGYNVETEAKNDPKLGSFISLTIGW